MTDISGTGTAAAGAGRLRAGWGRALLDGWLKNGLRPGGGACRRPQPAWRSSALGISVNGELPAGPAVLVIAVKPQMMADVLPQLMWAGPRWWSRSRRGDHRRL